MVAVFLAVLLSLLCFGAPETNPSDLKASEKQQILDLHNALRRGVQPTARNMLKMSWSDEAAANAQKYAGKCIMEHSEYYERDISTCGCGENLSFFTYKEDWSKVIQMWYDEVKNFKYGEDATELGAVVGHYTQIVLYRSNLVGCAMAECTGARSGYLYVCHYCPLRAYQLTEPYSDGPSCADCPDACDDKLCTNPCPYFDQAINCPKLKEEIGCNFGDTGKWCPATCGCTSEIK